MKSKGFSLIEMVVSLAILLVLVIISIPSLDQGYQTYLLNRNASSVSSTLKLARFEAIRRNRIVNCQIQQIGMAWTVWSDTNGDGLLDPTEAQYTLTANDVLLPSSEVPDPSSMGYNSVTSLSEGNSSVGFDFRGAVYPASVVSTVYVIYIGNAAQPRYGFRAVALMPTGNIQVWTATTGSNWQKLF